ncbi:MAG TPA: bifunctional oligoribonuclease/PAP phosphatase NrnA [Chitinophagales bacterium]|nr:bifunctional oligoribonuclease/PAP phosphatase NrnA [Chitinophagales bacterium]
MQAIQATGLDGLKDLLATPRRIVITTHHKPDGDALGSTLALFHFLKERGHKVFAVTPTDYPDFLFWLPGEKEVVNFQKQPDYSDYLVSQAEIIFCLDFNKLYRINELGTLIEKSEAVRVLIDHHQEPDEFSQYSHHRTSASSTAELVYEFIFYMADKDAITPDIANCLYAGILTDTDRFRVSTTSPAVHRIVADLIEKGADHLAIYQNIYETFPEYKLRFFGFCITERMEIFPELHTGIIAVETADIKRFGIRTGDTEGLVNFPLQLGVVKMAVIIIQRPDQVKLSFRSKGTVDVNALARDHFEGGGHRNAAGGKSNVNVEETKKNLISILSERKNEIFT